MVDRFRHNNLDLLRFLFAGTVFLVHSHVLSGAEALSPLSRWLSSDVAVKAFFVISGMLVFKSFEESRSLAIYLEKRVRRIYPGYLAVILVAAVVLSAASELPLGQYFSDPGLASYLGWNLLFLNFVHPNLPGVFGGNPLSEINGALWTLKVEVMFYASVPLIVWVFRRVGRAGTMLVLYAASIAYVLVLERLYVSSGAPIWLVLARQLPGQMPYFLAGAAIYYYLPQFERWIVPLICGALACLAASHFLPNLPIRFLEPAWLGILVGFFGLFACVGNFGRYGDYSYGVYIIHFPVIQLLVQAGVFAHSPWLGLGAAAVLVLTFSILLWHLVEKRWLRRSSHYVTASREAAR